MKSTRTSIANKPCRSLYRTCILCSSARDAQRAWEVGVTSWKSNPELLRDVADAARRTRVGSELQLCSYCQVKCIVADQ